MNEVNRLMDKFAKDYDDSDVDEIIAFVRKQLAMYDAGVKPKKDTGEQINMAELVANLTKGKAAAPTKSTFKRRI